MKLIKLTQKRMILKPENVDYQASTGNLVVVLLDTSQPLMKDLVLKIPYHHCRSYASVFDSGLITLVEEALSKHYDSTIREFRADMKESFAHLSFFVEEVQVEHADFMHTYEKSVTTSALIEIQIDELEGENGDSKYQFEGQVFEPKDLVKSLQGYPTSDVLQLLYDANISHRQYSPLELAQEINNGSDNFSNSYVIATVTIEVQSGTK